MPKKTLQKFFPSPETIQKHPSLKVLRPLMSKPNLWHLNRHSVARAFFVGIFCAFLPLPFQMLLAALLAFYANSNLPVSVGLVWISNPVTIPPIFYGTYMLGSYLLDIPSHPIEVQLSLDWALAELNQIWQPLFAGSIVAALIFASIGYLSITIAWRLHIIKHWQQRHERRALYRIAMKARKQKQQNKIDNK